MPRTRVHPLQAAAVLATSLLATALPAAAQRGDREGHEMKQVWRQFEVPESTPLAPAEAMATFRVAPGFRVELVAAEPLVEDPVAMAWDERGLLYVVEMRGFMPNVDGIGEQEPVGRVVVLEDLDDDGAMDRSGVYLDGLVSPRAIAAVSGGILIGEPPNLWFCLTEQEPDGLPRCARRERLLEYGDPDPDELEHTENGLLWALDNWIYNAKSDRRFRLRRTASGGIRVEVDRTLFRGQWGIAQDDWGRLYYNTNSRFLFADLLPPEPTLIDTPSSRDRAPGINERLVHDETVYPVRVNPGINRGYVDRMLRPDGRLAVTTSVSGVAIYRGDQFPAFFHGDAFVPEPAANAVAHFDLVPGPIVDGAPTLAAEHRRYGDPEWLEREFLASTDERFRPVDVKVGPDGGLYVIDMYRGILQHVRFVTTYLREYILEHGLDRPLGMGRIYRIVWEGESDEAAPIRRQSPALNTTGDRIAALADPNGWRRDTAQRLLVEDGVDDSGRQSLVALARTGRAPLTRIHAMWTLAGLNELDGATVLSAVAQSDTWLVVHALRAGGQVLAESGSGRAAIAELLDSASPQVRAEALLALGAAARTGDAWARNQLAERAASNPNDRLHQRVWSAASSAASAATPITPASPSPTAEESALLRSGRRHYRACRSCHGNDGRGQGGMGPSLVDSPWVTGSPERLAALVLHGLEGPIEVHGEIWNDLMPGFASDPRLSNEALAALLSFIRGSWGNHAPPVSVELVARTRQRTAERRQPWTAAELQVAYGER